MELATPEEAVSAFRDTLGILIKKTEKGIERLERLNKSELVSQLSMMVQFFIGLRGGVPFVFTDQASNAALTIEKQPDLMRYTPFPYCYFVCKTNDNAGMDPATSVCGVHISDVPVRYQKPTTRQQYDVTEQRFVMSFIGNIDKKEDGTFECGFRFSKCITGIIHTDHGPEAGLMFIQPYGLFVTRGPLGRLDLNHTSDAFPDDSPDYAIVDYAVKNSVDGLLRLNEYLFARGPVIVKEKVDPDSILTRKESHDIQTRRPLEWRGVYRVLVPEEAEVRYVRHGLTDATGKPLTKGAWVRSHTRLYQSDRYINMKGQRQIIQSFWRGPQSWTRDGITYVVKSAIDQDKRSPDEVWRDL